MCLRKVACQMEFFELKMLSKEIYELKMFSYHIKIYQKFHCPFISLKNGMPKLQLEQEPTTNRHENEPKRLNFSSLLPANSTTL